MEKAVSNKENSNQPSIGTLAEKSLHASLKSWYAEPGDQIEVKVDGYIIDIKRGDSLIEIQTRNFSAIKQKLVKLCQDHQIHLVHPIAQEKWIIRVDKAGKQIRKRKSPKRGRVEHIFQELIRIPSLLLNHNFSLEVILTQAEEIWQNDGKGSWRRKGWSIQDQKLLSVLSSEKFNSATDFLGLLPDDLPEEFTNQELTKILKLPRSLAGKMTYTLRKMGLIHIAGKQRNAYIFKRNN